MSDDPVRSAASTPEALHAIIADAFSRALSQASWPTTRIARGDLAAEIAALEQESGPDVIARGGASFAAAEPVLTTATGND